MIEPMPSQQKRIKGCIDHHNSVLQTPTPIFLDIRPWGSCCSILAHNYIRRGKQMSQAVARILLCGILSDTINLMSPTTTDADRIALVMLKKLARVDDLDLVAQLQFRAKTASFVALSPFALVQADMKCFQSTSGVRFAWATVEVTDVEGIYAKAPELIGELRLLKEAKEKQYAAAGETNAKLPYAFLSIVNLSNQRSQILLCGGRELCLARAAFKGPIQQCPGMDERRFAELGASKHLKQEETMMDLGEKVSRKLEFVPPVMALLDAGWEPSEMVGYRSDDELPPLVEQIHLEDCADVGSQSICRCLWCLGLFSDGLLLSAGGVLEPDT
jgi:inorganic pyrophosphatase/exopolyphosphatase